MSSYLQEIKVKFYYLCECLFLFLNQEVCSFLRSRKGDEQTIAKFKEQKVIILRQQICFFLSSKGFEHFLRWLDQGGILPKIAHMGRFCSKGGLFQAGCIIKGQSFHKLRLDNGRKFRYM